MEPDRQESSGGDTGNQLVVQPNLDIIQKPELSNEDMTAIMESRMRKKIKAEIASKKEQAHDLGYQIMELKDAIREIGKETIQSHFRHKKYGIMQMMREVDRDYEEEELEYDLVPEDKVWGPDYEDNLVSFIFSKENEGTSFCFETKIPLSKENVSKYEELLSKKNPLVKERDGLYLEINRLEDDLKNVSYAVRKLRGDLLNAMLEKSDEAKSTLDLVDSVLDTIEF